MPRLPLLAVTVGDPGGIGPEVAAAALRDPAARRAARFVAVGPRAVWRRAGLRAADAGVLDPLPGGPARFARGPSAAGGRASYAAVLAALRLVARGAADGLVTAPVSKESWSLAGAPQLDHTALISEATGARRIGMLLVAPAERGRPPLRAMLVTRHLPLSAVPRAAGEAALVEAAELASEALRGRLGIRRPRLGLCGLNPHAGDNGLIGTEERERLGPAAARLRARGLRVAGPIPADAAWARHAAGEFDALLALYHDQALIPLKALAGTRVVNWTLGAPLVRTSPGHGTAYDLAGRGKADPGGMIHAVRLAAELARR